MRLALLLGPAFCVASCGLVWLGASWCGLVWLVVAWCGLIWLGVAWCGLARLGMARLRLRLALLGTRFPALLGAAQCYLEVGARRGLVGAWLGGCVVGGCVRVRVWVQAGVRVWVWVRVRVRVSIVGWCLACGAWLLVVGVHLFRAWCLLGVYLACLVMRGGWW